MGRNTVVDVAVATVAGQLPAPVTFGSWVMRDREFVVVRVRSSSGHEGWAFTLSRDGAVAEQLRRSIAPTYVGSDVGELTSTFRTAWRRNLASHASGVGLRALSIMDLAMWDLAAVTADQSIAEFLGGTAVSMPATAIVGYPPAELDGARIGAQVTQLADAGWRRFKAPMAATPEASAERLAAVRAACPLAWVGCDAAWMFDDVDAAVEFAELVAPVQLGWFEDVFPPGDAGQLAELRRRVQVPIAMGDEQGGSYYPEALLLADAVDVVRVDLTCMGGITGGRSVVDRCLRAGVDVAPHMFGHVHSQVFSAWGFQDAPIEWGVPWTGVDPYADSLGLPRIEPGSGRMQPLDRVPGFGALVNLEWINTQPHHDPDGLFAGK